MMKNGADYRYGKCLLEQGVDTVFGYPGGTILNVYDAFYKYSHKIKHILTAHEQGAAHAADGYARSAGRAAVMFWATSGPGATNSVTGSSHGLYRILFLLLPLHATSPLTGSAKIRFRRLILSV